MSVKPEHLKPIVDLIWNHLPKGRNPGEVDLGPPWGTKTYHGMAAVFARIINEEMEEVPVCAVLPDTF